MTAQLPNYTCKFTTGDGVGGTEFRLYHLTVSACVEACVRQKKTDATINGVTIYSDGRMGCWCEQNMKSKNSASTTYKTCLITFNGKDISKSFSLFLILYRFCSNKIHLWCTYIIHKLKLKLARLVANCLTIFSLQLVNDVEEFQVFVSRVFLELILQASG